MRLAVAVCLLAACEFHHGGLSTADATGGGDDGATDATANDGMIDACASFSTHLDTCAPSAAPGDALALSGSNTYDTDTQTLTTPAGDMPVPSQLIPSPDGDIVAILVKGFSLTGTLRVVGDDDHHPFGIVSYGTVTIDGLIDLTDGGAGSRSDTVCDDLKQKGHRGADDNGGGSGGGGGAFAGAGGGGGNGDKDGNSDGGQSTGAEGGTAAAARPTHIAGGCDGGGGGNAGGDGGSGGHGGGAIFIASSASITIETNGGINAGGGGGRPGQGNGGGGAGGGSGGMIVLEAGSIIINGKLAANGGGGGEGADGNTGEIGETGLLATTRASGGAGNAGEGGDGAAGGAGTNLGGQSATQLKNGGGGGGGGGAGFIGIGPAAPLNTGTISPTFQAWP
jgi:hypothetical protein